jgi:diguanylate cyclase (GGDEF)-like protein
MRFPIAWRLALVLVIVGVLGAGITGYFAYQASREMLVKSSKERLLTATRVLMRQVTVALKGVASDVRLLARHPQAVRILQHTDPAFQARSERNIAQLFEGMLSVHPEYFQMRLIEAGSYGMERIRVDRDTGGILIVAGDELQEKGHYPYVFDTLRLPPGAVYVSQANINHETGAHAGEQKPSLQVAAPVHDATGRAVGVFVVNVDLNGLFTQLAADLPSELKLYLANDAGDFLIHPDPARSFAFDRGQQARVQEEFPETAVLFGDAGQRPEHVVTRGSHQQDALVAAFVMQALPGLQTEDRFILGLAQPLSSVLAESRRLAAETLGIVLAYSILAILLAILLARALSRPLSEIVAGVRRFPVDGKVGALPVARHDEIGELARSIEQMEMRIARQMEDLHAQKVQLDHLASHDSLTGLPNRRLFIDRLDQALARAKRQHSQLALLFLDLDNFKAINDVHGHAAGDRVLQVVAQRLRAMLRESDTAARLGGDEFVILIEGACDDDSLRHLAGKVQALLAEPIAYQDIELLSGGSVGVACYPRDGSSTTTLIAAADHAMYRCKASRA